MHRSIGPRVLALCCEIDTPAGLGGTVAGAALWSFLGLGGLWLAAALLALASRIVEGRMDG